MLEPWTTEQKKEMSFNERYSLMLSDRQNCPISTSDTAVGCIQKYIKLRGFEKDIKSLSFTTGVPISTFSKMKTGKYKPDLRTLVALEIGLNIDYERSMLIIQKGGFSLNDTKEHVLFKFLLENHGKMTKKEVDALLKTEGFRLLAGSTRDKPNKSKKKISH